MKILILHPQKPLEIHTSTYCVTQLNYFRCHTDVIWRYLKDLDRTLKGDLGLAVLVAGMLSSLPTQLKIAN